MKLVLPLMLSRAAYATECSAPWQFAGPTAWVDGAADLQTVFEKERGGGEDVLRVGAEAEAAAAPSLTASVSTHRVVAGKNGTWFVATGNAGIWRTADVTAAEPHWESVTDGQPVACVAMAALEVASFNSDLVAAGCGGSTSGEMGETWNELINGEWKGVMVSRDGGDSWAMTSFPVNYNVGSVRFVKPSTLLVAARGHFFDPKNGGIWKSTDMGKSWTKTFDRPTVELLVVESAGLIVAALGEDPHITWQSQDNGDTWAAFDEGIDFGGYIPFYSHMTYASTSPPTAFLAVYAVNPTNPSVDHSPVWYRTLDGSSTSKWTPIKNTPNSLDADKMPKDKIAVLSDPNDSTLLYVAANVGNMYRVKWQTGQWSEMGSADTSDRSEFHADCRHLAWEPITNSLLLTNDGGIHRRTQPQAKGGRWLGSSGDIQTMEYTYAFWDARNLRYVAGAQDNSVQVTMPRKNTLQPPYKFRATGVVGGDGNRVMVDNVHCPSRMFGSAQFLDGLSYVSGGADGKLSSVQVDLAKTFSSPWNFPYFVMASALNSQDPSSLYFYANGTAVGKPQGVYRVTVPDRAGVAVVPELVAKVPDVLDIVAGGFTDGKSDAGVMYMMTTEQLFTLRDGKVDSSPLPMKFFTPVTLHALNALGNDWVLGPLSHGNSVWLTVSPKDSRVLGVTGWPADINNGNEGIFFSRDGGKTFANITGNLASAAGVSSRIRPQGLLIVNLDSIEAVLVGTVSGVYVAFSDSLGAWTRVGSLSSKSFPLVMDSGLSYEPYTDTLVAATYGRGVFILEGAQQMLLHIHDQQKGGSCDVPIPAAPSSSSRFFPPMQPCSATM